jgi:hypothetical protein
MTNIEQKIINFTEENAEAILDRAEKVYNFSVKDIAKIENKYSLANLFEGEVYDLITQNYSNEPRDIRELAEYISDALSYDDYDFESQE